MFTAITVTNLKDDDSVDEDVLRNLKEKFESTVNPFNNFSSKYFQDKYIETNMNTIKPQEIILGNALRYKRRQETLVLEEYPETSIFVSLLETLQQILCDKQTAEMLLKNYANVREGVYYDIFDGNYFKNSQFFKKQPICFKILIFQDALEICNPLGNRSGKHKVVMFYWTLVNINPKFRSRLSSIKLFAMVKKKVLDKYGFLPVLRPFFEELEQLYNGVDFIINDKKVTCFGNVILCLYCLSSLKSNRFALKFSYSKMH